MFFSLTVYALLVFLLFYGCKSVAKLSSSTGTSISTNVFSVDTAKCLQGFCALCVVLHHLSQNKDFSKYDVLGVFENIGYLFVAVFFFCSGFGLVRSYDTKKNYLDGFVKKRMVPILVAFFVMNLIYALYRLLNGEHFPPVQWITGILGLVLLNNQAWYVIVILIMYTIFYVCFKNIKNRKISFAIVFASILVQGSIFCVLGHFAWWSKPDSWQELLRGGGSWWQSFGMLWFQGEWWVNSTVAFLVGMLVANYFESILVFLGKKYWLKFFVLALICIVTFEFSRFAQWKISYWSEFGGNLGIKNKFICYFAQMAFVIPFVLSVFMLSFKVKVGNKPLRFLGGFSLELYLMQLIPITSWADVVMKRENLAGDNRIWYMILYSVLVILSSLVLAIIYKWIHRRITSLID